MNLREGRIPTGKGMFIWLLSRLDNGNMTALADRLQAEGYSWVAVKMVNGSWLFGGTWDPVAQEYPQYRLLEELIPLLKARGIELHGWGYYYGKSLSSGEPSQVQAEIAVTLEAMQKYQPLSYMLDCEAEYKRPGMGPLADEFCRGLKAGMAVSGDEIKDIPLALSSFRFPTYHPELPWSSFVPYMDYWAPQVYYQGDTSPNGSQLQLERALQEYQDLKPLPFVPAGTVYPEGSWWTSPEQLELFNQICKSNPDILGVNYWEYYYPIQFKPELLGVLASFEWPGEDTPAPEPDMVTLSYQAYTDLLHNMETLASLVQTSQELLAGAILPPAPPEPEPPPEPPVEPGEPAPIYRSIRYHPGAKAWAVWYKPYITPKGKTKLLEGGQSNWIYQPDISKALGVFKLEQLADSKAWVIMGDGAEITQTFILASNPEVDIQPDYIMLIRHPKTNQLGFILYQPELGLFKDINTKEYWRGGDTWEL